MKVAFLISGYSFNQTPADNKYADLRKAISKKGYKVIPSPFQWNRTTVSKYVTEFADFYNKNKDDYNILIGNSYGAMVSFLVAPIVKPDRILLCSLSPYFIEDADKTTKEYRLKRFGKRREEAMKRLSAKKTADAINKTNIEVTMLYGEQEKEVYGQLVERVKETAKELNNVTLVEVPNAPHPFIYPAYIKGIAKVL